MVLKGEEAVGRTAGTVGSTRPARGVEASGTAAAVTTPGATVCYTGGSEESAAKAAASGKCAAATGALHSTSIGLDLIHRSQCVISSVAAVRLTRRTVCHNTQSLLPSNCTRRAAVKRPLKQLTVREHTLLPLGD